MQSRARRFRANLYYLKQPLRDFAPLLILLLGVLVAGCICFKTLYHQEPLSYVRALYITYCLIFMEHLLEFPEHWVLQLFYLFLPLLGLIVILDGIVRLSYHVLRRDESGKEWVRAMTKTLNDHVILCGLGKVGLRILQQLMHLGEHVAVLEKRADCQNLAYARKHGIPVLIGNGREDGILDDLNLANAKSIILATNDDLANLEMAIDARKVNPDIRVVMRMFDQELAAKIRESFDIHLAFSTSELAAPVFATSSSDRSIINSFYAGDQLLVVAELIMRPESELAGKKVGELGKDKHIVVISHGSGEQQALFPASETLLMPGDRFTIQTTPETLKEVHRMNSDPEPY